MRLATRIALFALAGAGITILVAGLGHRREVARHETARRKIADAASSRRPISDDELSHLPSPVQRYVALATQGTKRSVSTATVTQRGRMRESVDASWMSFVATQTYSLDPPAFVWLADASMGPGLPVVVRDELVDGRGRTRALIGGVIPVVDAAGPAVDQGAALRFWGEVLAFPESAANPRLRWVGVDDHRARLLVTQAEDEIDATVDFENGGLVSAIHATRFRMVDGTSVPTPWTGSFSKWRTMAGRTFPTHWESIWNLPEGDLLAVEMDILTLETTP